MRVRAVMVVLCVVSACARKPEPPASAPAQRPAVSPAPDAALPDATVDPSPDAAVVPATAGCVGDPGARSACASRGSAFAYGPPPFIYCSGVAANTRGLAQQHANAQETQPCVCNNLREIEERRRSCSMVPSTRR